MKNLLIYTTAIVIGLSFSSCNRNGTAYYMFKWVGNKKLKTQTSIYVENKSSIAKIRKENGQTIGAYDTAVEFVYLDDHSANEYASMLESKLRTEFDEEEMIVRSDSKESAAYILEVECAELTENVEIENTPDNSFEISHCKVKVCVRLLESNGVLISEDSFTMNENENLKEKTNDDGEIEYTEQTFSISFENLISRIADRTEAWTETRLAKRLN